MRGDSAADSERPLVAIVLAWILRVGVPVAGSLLLVGLALGAESATEAGILVLLATPILALGAAFVFYVKERDWWVAGACLAVAAVLGTTVFLAL